MDFAATGRVMLGAPSGADCFHFPASSQIVRREKRTQWTKKPVAPGKALAYVPRSVSLEASFSGEKTMMPGEDRIALEGTVVEVLGASLFCVALVNGHRLLGHVSRRGQLAAATLQAGDRVNLEMSPFDFSKGRIVLEQKQNESPRIS
jgi:translation initiation factor IF-1